MGLTDALLDAIGVTAELTGTQLSKQAIRVLAGDLARYPEAQVLGALSRCRRELKGRLTIADVLTRLEDGRPGPEEAWALMPMDESQSVVWTAEMATAYGVAYPLIRDGETVAARMAFLESYRKELTKARDESRVVRWTPSLGHDPLGRQAVLQQAVALGRLSQDHVAGLLPHRDEPPSNIAGLLPDMSPKRTLKEALEHAKKRA